jgi:hypothetical protein
MKQNHKRNAKGRPAKSVLRLPDLEVAKSAVLNSLSCPDAQCGYRHAIDEFVDWYCSEPRLSFSKTVVLRTECIWNPAISLPVQSTFVLEPCAVLRMRQPTAGFSAQTWRLGYGESRA